jgi:Dyp-type peroxidase family
MQFANVDYDDIQGLVRYGHGHLKAARFLVLQIVNVDAARAWLAAAPVTTAVDCTAIDPARLTEPPVPGEPPAPKEPPERKLPDHALQVAFTHDGLAALGASKKILEGFSDEFIGGMVEPSRSRRLGDVDGDDPEHWTWGGRGATPHVLVLLYAATTDRLDTWQAQLQSQLWTTAFSEVHRMSTSDMHGREPFGFVDGISQPELDWERRKPARLRTTRGYTNLAALGEFLLGYPNEYGKYTDRPLLEASDDPQRILPLAEDRPGQRDFGRNGSYLVVRDLSQKVADFWRYVDAQAQHDPGRREALAHAMVGRKLWGDPIVPLSEGAVEGVAEEADEGKRIADLWRNQFTYDADPDGTACPFGAHIRRANPRNADLPAGTRGPISRLMRVLGFGGKRPRDDVIASTRFHRILRRGREYGEELMPERALKSERDEGKRGLRFICFNANIARQFEFIQTSWLANPKFDGANEGDPLIGNRVPLWAGAATDTFTRPQDSGVNCRIAGLHQFVTVHGGAYFFMPGISALRYLARAPRKSWP